MISTEHLMEPETFNNYIQDSIGVSKVIVSESYNLSRIKFTPWQGLA